LAQVLPLEIQINFKVEALGWWLIVELQITS
jgi:hypothetical protein